MRNNTIQQLEFGFVKPHHFTKNKVSALIRNTIRKKISKSKERNGSLFPVLEQKKLITELINQWKTENQNNRTTRYLAAIKDFLKEVDYEPTKLNQEVIQQVYAKKKWSTRHMWPKTALYKFLKWLNKKPQYYGKIDQSLLAEQTSFNPLPPTLEQQISQVLDSRISRLTKENIVHTYRNSILKSFKIFNDFVGKLDPNCKRNSLSCFTRKHILAFKREMEQEGKLSPFTNKKVSKSYLSQILINVRNVFTYAEEQGIITQNPFQNIKIPKYNSHTKTTDYLTNEQIDKITQIDKQKLQEMECLEKYWYLLPRVMIKVCYEIAARLSEIVNLCIEDININKLRPTGLIPVNIIGGKHRPAGYCDTVYILYYRIKDHLEIWLDVLNEVYKQLGQNQQPVDIPKRKVKGIPLFPYFDRKRYSFTLIRKEIFKNLFKSILKENQVAPNLWGRTHILRISRITNWVNEGWDFYDVHKNARHCKFEETERYFHGSDEDRARRIEKNLNLTEVPGLPKFSFSDKNILQYIIYKTIEKINSEPKLISSPTNIIPVVNILSNEILNQTFQITDKTQYYTLNELEKKWNISHSQTWKKIKNFETAGYLHPFKNSHGELCVPKWEIDEFESKFIQLSEAIKIENIFTKGKIDYLRTLIMENKLAGIKIGRLYYVNLRALYEWLLKRIKKTNV